MKLGLIKPLCETNPMIEILLFLRRVSPKPYRMSAVPELLFHEAKSYPVPDGLVHALRKRS